MTARDESVGAAHPPIRVEGGGSSPTSSLQLRLRRVSFPEARELNARWHRLLPRIGDPESIMKAALCFVAEYDGRPFAVAIWSHPVNRNFDRQTHLELRRLAIAPEAPRNTASRLLGVMRRFIRKYRPEVKCLLSYQDTSTHAGTIYRAAGWKPVGRTRFKPWSNQQRQRPSEQARGAKIRWEIAL